MADLKEAKVKRGIRFKLMGMFLVLIGLPLMVVGVMMYLRSYETLERDLEKNSKQALNITENSIGNYLREFKFMAELAASEPSMQGVLRDQASKEQSLAILDRIVAADKDVMAIYLGDVNGGMTIKPDQSLPDGYDPRVRGWYKAAEADGNLIFTEPYVDAFTGKLVISPAVPVYDKTDGNKLVGILGADVLLDSVVDAVAKTQIGKTGYVFIVGSDLSVMSNPDPELIGKKLEEDPEMVELVTAIKELAATDANMDVFVSYELGGVKKYATVRKSDLGYLVANFEASEVAEGASANLIYLVTLGTGALLLAMVVSWLFAKNLTARINDMLKRLLQVRNGDLSVNFKEDTHDEIGVIGHHLSDTFHDLSGLVREIKAISNEVTMAAQNLAATSEETSASAEEVARTVNEIAKGASEQSHDAERGVSIAQSLSVRITELSARTQDMIESAKSVVAANETGMNSLNGLKDKTRQSDDANTRIEAAIMELDKKTQSIEAILDTISAISVQTNLLALNASIEAARAGEHGRGFAVVAEEIRKLAEQSSQAADEVRVIVTNIKADSTKTVTSMKDVRLISQEQSHAVSEVSGSFQIIFESIERISDMIKTISGFVADLGSDRQNIVGSIENISAVSQETAAAAEEVSASMDQQSMAVDEVARSAERLNEISVDLSGKISKFKV